MTHAEIMLVAIRDISVTCPAEWDASRAGEQLWITDLMDLGDLTVTLRNHDSSFRQSAILQEVIPLMDPQATFVTNGSRGTDLAGLRAVRLATDKTGQSLVLLENGVTLTGALADLRAAPEEESHAPGEMPGDAQDWADDPEGARAVGRALAPPDDFEP